MEKQNLKKMIIEVFEEKGTYNGRSLSSNYYVVDPEVIANAFITKGIGNVAEWKHRANDYKQRAEVAEKERNECERKTEIAQKAGKIIQRDMLRVFGGENPVINDKINALWDLALQQAAREIEENTLRQALLTVEEERK